MYERNEQLLALVQNWRRAFDLARRRFPAAPYFAWVSDHDVWHPEWLRTLGAELDAHPEAVLAYPLGVRIDDTAPSIRPVSARSTPRASGKQPSACEEQAGTWSARAR